MKNNLLLCLMVFFLIGCSNKYPVTFDSNPKGASLICNGKNWGYTPKTLFYDERIKKQNYLDISSCSANWISGYSKKYGTISTQQFPNGVHQTLERPFGDGYEKDARFALDVQQIEYQKRQATAAEASARANQEAADDAYWQNRKRNSELEQINDYLMLKRLSQ